LAGQTGGAVGLSLIFFGSFFYQEKKEQTTSIIRETIRAILCHLPTGRQVSGKKEVPIALYKSVEHS